MTRNLPLAKDDPRVIVLTRRAVQVPRFTLICGLLLLTHAVLVLPVSGQAFFVYNGPITNGGFESGTLSPWYQSYSDPPPSGAENWHVTTDNPRSGAYSARAVGNDELRQDFPAIATSNILELSFWLEHPSASVNAVAVDFFYSDGRRPEILRDTSTTGWEYFNVTSALSPGMLTGIGIYGNFEGVTYLDDVTLTLVPEPTTFALVSFGLLAIGLATRKM